ncbi:MAG: acyltransferase [Leptolyngbyaceae cyanobacterium bins.349]|nr:acyltransferase [Leptolyngbyaceae cyanobacterium bins.349]
MKFTVEKTNIAKGVAICLMFANHLYAFPERLIHGNYYIPFIPFWNGEFFIGNFGGVCVSIFIFLSGYGMFLGFLRSGKTSLQYCLEKVKEFYLTYWTYFLIFVPVGLIFFKEVKLWNSNVFRYAPDWLTVLLDLSGWTCHYNAEWWFVHMFILLTLFLSPLYIILSNRNPILLCLIAISLFLAALMLKISYSDNYSFIFWQISFAVGLLCARSNFFSCSLFQDFENLQKRKQLALCVVAILTCVLLRLRFGAKVDFLLIAGLTYCFVRGIELLKLSRIFFYLGKYSFPMWLVHSFFCYYYFQDLIYYPKWSPLIFILLLGVSLLTVIVIEKTRFHLKTKLRDLSYLID